MGKNKNNVLILPHIEPITILNIETFLFNKYDVERSNKKSKPKFNNKRRSTYIFI